MNIHFKSPDKRKPPVDDYTETLPRCKNCGEAFEEHIDTEDGYLCSFEHQRQPTYGGFYGGDPRLFHPDYEVCSEQEILNYKMACLRADSNPRERDLPCDCCENRKFGLGVTTYPPTQYERP